jgi:hypothetical protein
MPLLPCAPVSTTPYARCWAASSRRLDQGRLRAVLGPGNRLGDGRRRRQEASRARGQPTAFARVEEERRRRAVEAEARRAAAETARLDGVSRNAARAARERESAARLQAAAAECEALRARRAELLADGAGA